MSKFIQGPSVVAILPLSQVRSVITSADYMIQVMGAAMLVVFLPLSQVQSTLSFVKVVTRITGLQAFCVGALLPLLTCTVSLNPKS